MLKYLISFIFGLIFSFVYLFGNSFFGKSYSFEYLATRYYQIFYPEQLIKNGKEYSVSFDFVPVVFDKEKGVVDNDIIKNEPVKEKLTISYSYQNNFDGFSKEEVENIFKEVEKAWAPCGVILKYKGLAGNSSNPFYSGKSIYASNAEENSNYLYWVEQEGIYGEAATQSSQELNSKTKPFINNFNIKLSTTIESKERLKATIVHEFGHVIGLSHSSDPKSVMYFEGGKTNQLSSPNAYDIQECKNVLTQIDLAKTNQMLN